MKNNLNDNEIDQILKHVLSPIDEPNYILNKKIISQIKEKETMKLFNKKKLPVLIFTIISIITLGAVSAFATARYLTPSIVATKLKDKTLANAFNGKDAVNINKSQIIGSEKYTLLGMISGKSISQFIEKDDLNKIKNNKTYIVVSIENTDGSQRPKTTAKEYSGSNLIITPFVKGISPTVFNIHTIGGGYSEFIQDGIQYRLIEMDNLEMFADKGIYLAICHDNNYNKAFNFNEQTGEITPNTDYDKNNLIFDLPIDKSKANTTKAKEYLESLSNTENNSQIKPASKVEKTIEELSKMSANKIIKQSTKIEKLTQILTPTKDGYITYSYTISKDAGSANGTTLLSGMLENKKENEPIVTGITGDDKNVYIEIIHKNSDKTITLDVYKYNK